MKHDELSQPYFDLTNDGSPTRLPEVYNRCPVCGSREGTMIETAFGEHKQCVCGRVYEYKYTSPYDLNS